MFCQKCGNKVKNMSEPCPRCGNEDFDALQNSYRKEDLIAGLMRQDSAFSLVWGDMTPPPLPQQGAPPVQSAALQQPQFAGTARSTTGNETMTPPSYLHAPSSEPSDAVPMKKQLHPWVYTAAGAAGMLAICLVFGLILHSCGEKETVQTLENSKTTAVQETVVTETESDMVSVTTAVVTTQSVETTAEVGDVLYKVDLEYYNHCVEVETLCDPNVALNQVSNQETHDYSDIGSNQEAISRRQKGFALEDMLETVKTAGIGSATESEELNTQENTFEFQSTSSPKIMWNENNSSDVIGDAQNGYRYAQIEGDVYFKKISESGNTLGFLTKQGNEDKSFWIQENEAEAGLIWDKEGKQETLRNEYNPDTKGKQYYNNTEDGTKSVVVYTEELNDSTDNKLMAVWEDSWDAATGETKPTVSFYLLSGGRAYPIKYVFYHEDESSVTTSMESSVAVDSTETSSTAAVSDFGEEENQYNGDNYGESSEDISNDENGNGNTVG